MTMRLPGLLMPLFLCSWTMHAQFPSFPDSNAYWLTSAYDQQGLLYQADYHMRETNHDTLLNGLWYSSLWTGAEGEASEFSGGIRKDTDGRIFYYHPNTSSEYLLYDFDPVVGESMVVWFGPPSVSDPYLLLMHIASIEIAHNANGTPYKVIGVINDVALNSGQGSNETWIEGVGGSGGLFTTEGTAMFMNFLECMLYNDTLWPSGMPGSCSPQGVPEIENNAVMLSPNPSSGLFSITFPMPLTAASSYGVYDSLGKLLVQQPLQPGTSTTKIDLSHCKAGSYLIKVYGHTQAWHGKVLLE